MKTIFTITAILFLFVAANGQSIERQLIATSGGSYTGTSFSADYSVGETVVLTLTSPSVILTQGFQQPPFEFTPVIEPEPGPELSLFPNPGDGRFNLNLGADPGTSVLVEVYNVLGQELYSREFSTIGKDNELIELDLTHLATGTYYLHVFSGNQDYKNIQFIKVSK